MGDTTGIGWTDSTHNHWIGCDEVGPGCDHCYAKALDLRFSGGIHWGPDAPRKLCSERTRMRPLIWNSDGPGKHTAETFHRLYERPRRVFCASMADWADKRVPAAWRAELWDIIRRTKRLRWQLCTKRVPNIGKYLPEDWSPEEYGHVGFLATCVNQPEADRDIPHLLELKAKYGFSWAGISYEPALGPVNWRTEWADLDWIIGGGESGSKARDDAEVWYEAAALFCAQWGIAYFMKQMAHLRPIPAHLMIQQFPSQLCH